MRWIGTTALVALALAGDAGDGRAQGWQSGWQPSTAQAGPATAWTYCYALEAGARRFHLSRPFATTDAPAAVDARFARALRDQGIAAPGACPRAASREALQARMQASEAYARTEGNAPSRLDWPEEALARR